MRVVATDRDGFSATHTQTLRVKDPADTAAPQLAWSGALTGASANAQPHEVLASTALTAQFAETQLMGWRLQLAAVGSNRWQTLAEAETAASSVAQTLALATLDPQKLDNGLYQLRLSAWDLAGRSSEIAATLIIDSTDKTFASHSQADATLTLAGHTLALVRHWREANGDAPADERGDFGNWTLALLASQLRSDQATALANGAIAPWSLGARVWLTIPTDLADADAGLTQLSFVLGAQSERLGSEAGAAQVWQPSFSSDRGWTLQAHADGERSGADNLQRQGERLYERDSGLPWVPSAYTLTAPDGTRYTLDAQGTIHSISFTDGQSWLLSDAGIVAVNGAFAERVDFQRDSAGRIVRLSAPDGAGGTTAIAYRYDSAGRLILVRHLDDHDFGTPIAYDAAGQVLTDPLTANLGAVVNWASSSSKANAWFGELKADQAVSLAFTVRDSEIASTIHSPGGQGAVILALETQLPADGELEVVGAQIIGSSTVDGKVTRLLRVSEAGTKLIRITGSGAAQLRISVAGDLDRDGQVDAADSQAWEQAAATQDPLADIDGDGQIGSADRQVLVANSGFKANQAPAASAAASAALKTHTGLATRSALSNIAEDLEGDTLFWRILGSTHGSARLEANGQEVSFTPEAGYSGAATLTLQADDGFAAGAPIELTIDVSGARLLHIHLAPLPALASGQFARLQASVDFADEQSVAITDPAYLTLSAADLAGLGGSLPSPVLVDDARDLIHATGVGPALLMLQRVDSDGRLIQAAAALNCARRAAALRPDSGADGSESDDNYAGEESLPIEPDVYPGTLTLMPGDTRQLKVRLLDPNSDQSIDIHTPSQTTFAGTPETLESYVDPDSGESFEILIPATPPVYSGTRYLVSDATIATLSEDGLITALQAGEVSISIVHLASVVDPYGGVSEQVIGQSDIRLRVQAAALTDDDPSTATPAGITIAADQGGVVQAATGETVMIGAGALRDDAVVSIQRIAVADLLAETGMAAPEAEILQTLAAFRLDLGEQATSVPVQLAITLQDEAGVEVGDEVLFLRRGSAPDLTGAMQDKWWLLDNGFVGTDAHGHLVARTASPPYSGVSGSGDLILVKTRSDHQTGAVTVRGNGLNVFALTTNSLAISMAGDLASGGLSGAGAATNLIGLFAGMSEIYAINLDFGGVYQVVPVQKSLANGELTLTIATPGASESGTLDTATSPRISDVKMLASGKLQLTLENLQAAAVPGMAAQATALRLWVSPEQLSIDAQGKASSSVWPTDSQTKRDGMRLWQQLIDLAAVAPGASSMTVEVEIPAQLALGLHRLTVQRLLQTVDPSIPGASRWLANGEPGSVTLEGQTDFSVVTLADKIEIFRDGEIVNEIPYLDASGKAIVGGGSKTDQIAFSLDNRLLFVAGAHGNIHVIDTATMTAATSFSVGTANVSSLAVSGQWLYVAEGGPYEPTGSYRLLRVNIDETAADFLAIQQIELPATVSGQNAPYGYIDMAITHGAHSYLAVTASQQSVGVAMAGSQPDSGNVFILDLDQLLASKGRLTATSAGAFLQVDFPTREGKGPQYISSAGIKDNTLRLLLSDAFDLNAGLATVTVQLSDLGRLQGTPVFKQIAMSGALPGMSRLDGDYQLNIQRAQSPAVIVTRNGAEYALVADYFFDFVDPLDALDDPQNALRQMGGKIGIVRNPFSASPEYLGATSPIIDANFSRLQLVDAGKTLWADIRYWPTIGEPPPPSGLLVWDLDSLIAAAERNSLARQATPRPLPIDRERVDGVTTQIVTPSKLDLADSPQLTSGWVYGMATSQLLKPDTVEFSAPVDGGQFLKTTIEPDKDGKVPAINYGDIARIDLVKLIRDQYPSTLADLKDADLNINWDNIEIGGAATLVKDSKGFLLTAEREDGYASAQAATEKSYKSQQAVNTDGGKKTLKENGIIFLAPSIDVDRLRQGKALLAGDITITIKGYDKDDPEKRLLLKLRVVDYTRAAETVFFGDRPLNNPGYHPFKLAGSVGVGAENPNNSLDVWRVEQRLRYLGFPAYQKGSGINIKDFIVDGEFAGDEKAALKLFEKIIRFRVPGEPGYSKTGTLTNGNPDPKAVGNNKYAGDFNGADGEISPHDHAIIPDNSASGTSLEWLSAYNAPHWINIGAQMEYIGNTKQSNYSLPMWQNGDRGGETFGVSWMRDLMRAQEYADPQYLSGLPTTGSRFTAAIDGNGSNPGSHSAHWLGMSFDLSIKPYLDPYFMGSEAPEFPTTLSIDNLPSPLPTKDNDWAWSNENALALAEQLSNLEQPGQGRNFMADALRNFLALYSVTRRDDASAGSGWNSLRMINGDKARNAIFGDGSRGESSIGRVIIGGSRPGEAKLKRMKEIIDLLGLTSWQSFQVSPHHHHFHVDLHVPTFSKIGSNSLLLSSSEKSNSPAKDRAMLPMDSPPALDVQRPPTLATQTTLIAKSYDGLVGICLFVESSPAITLSPTAAGYGWFIDPTPSDNAEFLPTSNPFEWIARPGSEAEGRMDMLTVLLHEYGHAVGLDHTADSHDLMASTLLPSVRRLPSSTELIALRGLLAGTDSAPLPYDPSTPPGAPLPLSRSVGSLRLSRLRPPEPNDPTGDRLSAALTQFSIVANPTLLDPAFIDGAGWWSTSGEVIFVPGSATLKETAASQTRLNQAFVLGANDRSLSFTLADIALDDVDAAPDDAFEVALIDASTGLSLLGGTGLADNDAILNLQADGSEHKAAGVTTLRNADGSLSVLVDLTGIATGTVVNLSFDLIGFGRGAAAASSQVSIRDLHLGGGQSIEARDDVATTAEDTPVTINVLGNDLTGDFGNNPGGETNGIVPALVPILIDGPAHGDVAVNPDGSFTYRPHADWHGDDRFTYRLLGDGIESKPATVRLIVTPVNDAPTLAEIAANSELTLLEGQHFTAKASGTDVDTGDTLRYSLDAAPAGATIDPTTGSIDWQARDGDANYDFSVRVSDTAGESASTHFTLKVLNVAPTLSAGGLQATFAGEDFTLALSSSDPGDDRIDNWRIDWGDGQIIDIVDIAGNPGQVSHRYTGILGEVRIRATAMDEDGSYTLEPLAVAVLPPTLQVSSFSYDYNGFALRFNDVFDASQIKLYDSLLSGLGAADIVLAGSTGIVKGSLVIDADYRGLRCLIGGGGLYPDTYHLTLTSGPQAFRSAWGTLDGNADGVAGDDYRTSFTLDALPTTQLSLPDFMRGPGQAVNVPAAGEHLPLTLLSPGEVRRLSFVIRFDPALLEISAALPGSGLPADASLAIDRSVAGELRVSIASETAIAAGTVTLLDLVASVPATAPYGAQQILDIQQVSINAQSLPGVDRDGLHVVGYVGDANGNGTWERADVSLILHIATETDDEFAAWSRIDPLLVADIDADKRITFRDLAKISQSINGVPWPAIPELPTGLSLTFAAPQAWPEQPAPGQSPPQIDFGANFADFAIGSDDPRYRRDNWKTSFVTQLASRTISPNSHLQVTLEAAPQVAPSA
ncbi:MAG: Ig-like domain-containing protein [Candidatus Accumulibacter meliphilus]|jgi:hypothetical protein|uniref:Ig-like domain-containing protein n=1 Tax=Candidatus Accumulibacter meliphilus TaxID=2211374 RepID=UPI002FC2787C